MLMAKPITVELTIKGANELWRKTTKLFVGDPSSTADDSGRPVETSAVSPTLEEHIKETQGGFVYTPEWYKKQHGADVSPWQGAVEVGDPEPLKVKIDAADVRWDSIGELSPPPSGVKVIDDLWTAKYIDPLNQPLLLAVGEDMDLDPRDFDMPNVEFWMSFRSVKADYAIHPADWRIVCPLTNRQMSLDELRNMGKVPPSSLALLDRMAHTSPRPSSKKDILSMDLLGMSEDEINDFKKKYLGKLTSSRARLSRRLS